MFFGTFLVLLFFNSYNTLAYDYTNSHFYKLLFLMAINY